MPDAAVRPGTVAGRTAWTLPLRLSWTSHSTGAAPKLARLAKASTMFGCWYDRRLCMATMATLLPDVPTAW